MILKCPYAPHGVSKLAWVRSRLSPKKPVPGSPKLSFGPQPPVAKLWVFTSMSKPFFAASRCFSLPRVM